MAETIENVPRSQELFPCLAFDGNIDVEYLMVAF